MDFKNTKISIHRPITSYGKVRSFIGFIARRRRSQFVKHSVSTKKYLDIGCGPNLHSHFINLDYRWAPNTDVCWNVTRGIPLPTSSLKGIFSEHCFEHLPLASMPHVLSECHRLLQPGGVIRIIMPDAELYLTRYSQIRQGNRTVALPYSEGDSVEGIYSPILSVNRIFRGGHLFLYDFDFFGALLDRAGFTQIEKTSLRSGRDPVLLIDTESRAVESLYVEAVKES